MYATANLFPLNSPPTFFLITHNAVPICGLSQANRPHIALQKATSYRLKGGLYGLKVAAALSLKGCDYMTD